jgi:NitT/TauT family transport system permease protein
VIARPGGTALRLSVAAAAAAGALAAAHGGWPLAVLLGAAALALWQAVAGLRRLVRLDVHGKASLRLRALLVPTLFGLVVLWLWEIGTVGGGVPAVLMPAPSGILRQLAGSLPILAQDFVQTFLKAVLIGWTIGCLAGFLVAILADRSPFLRRGILPLAGFMAALPLIGIAPIAVMWFGFDWHSKAAVVVVMTFFPMLVNTVAGLEAAGATERDLMRSYAAGYLATLLKLRLPAALPFIFNALKINSTLALIGAIVAEFFGTPTVGMGFRISIELGRMNLEMVWAEVVMAAVAGTAFYGLLALAERGATFWHPSYRARTGLA